MLDQPTDATLGLEDVAARVLQFLADDPGRMARFFNITGLTAETIRAAAAAPGFAVSVLDYLLEDEPLLQLFAAEAEIRPEGLLRMRAGLERRGEGAPKAEGPRAAPMGPSNLGRQFGAA